MTNLEQLTVPEKYLEDGSLCKPVNPKFIDYIITANQGSTNTELMKILMNEYQGMANPAVVLAYITIDKMRDKEEKSNE